MQEENTLDVLELCQTYPTRQLEAVVLEVIRRNPLLRQRFQAVSQSFGANIMFSVEASDPDPAAPSSKDTDASEWGVTPMANDSLAILHPLFVVAASSPSMLQGLVIPQYPILPASEFKSIQDHNAHVAEQLASQLRASLHDEEAVTEALYHACRVVGYPGLPSSWPLDQNPVKVAMLIGRLLPLLRCHRSLRPELPVDSIPSARDLIQAAGGLVADASYDEARPILQMGFADPIIAKFYRLLLRACVPAAIPFQWLEWCSLIELQRRINALYEPNEIGTRFNFASSETGVAFRLGPFPWTSVTGMLNGCVSRKLKVLRAIGVFLLFFHSISSQSTSSRGYNKYLQRVVEFFLLYPGAQDVLPQVTYCLKAAKDIAWNVVDNSMRDSRAQELCELLSQTLSWTHVPPSIMRAQRETEREEANIATAEEASFTDAAPFDAAFSFSAPTDLDPTPVTSTRARDRRRAKARGGPASRDTPLRRKF